MMTRTGRRFSILFAAIAALAKTGSAAARRAFRRSARVLAAVALLALFGALALPTTAQAQEADVLVSNIDQPVASGSVDMSSFDIAQGFMTGASPSGNFALTSVNLKLAAGGTSPVVTVVTDNSGQPGSLHATLVPPASVVAGDNMFTAPPGTTLDAGTPYFLVISGGTGVPSLAFTSSTDEVSDTDADDWTIGDFSRYRSIGATGDYDRSFNVILLISVNGTAVGGDTPPPPSTDATLSGLSLGTGVTLDPTFAPGTLTYAVAVGNAVDEVTVTVTATTTDTNATPEFLDASDTTLDDAGTAAGHQVALAVGDTVFKVQVTAEDGTTTQTYTVTVTRAAADTPTCTLNTGDFWCGVVTVEAIEAPGVGLVGYGFSDPVSVGDLSDKEFSVGTNDYTIDGVFTGLGTNAGVLSFSLTSALTAADQAKLVLHVDSRSDPLTFSDSEGPSISAHTYKWNGTGLDWSSGDPVTLRLREAAVSTDATLTDLVVNDGSSDLTLTPTFAPGTTSYTAAVANSVDEVTVTPTTTDTNATPEFLNASDTALDDADDVANGHQVALAVGDTVFKVQVTAEDGTTTQTYTVTVTRAAQAQETDVLVSNIEQGSTTIDDTTNPRAQGFTIGSNPAGYVLSSVDVVSVDHGASSFTAKVCTTDVNGYPTATCTSLIPPDSFAAGTLSFTAPLNTVLKGTGRGRIYAVELRPGSGERVIFGVTNMNAEDSGEADGWSIVDDYVFLSAGTGLWTTNSRGQAHRIAVKGSEVPGPELTSASVGTTGIDIDLLFTLPLDKDNLPPTSAFTVNVGGVSARVEGIRVLAVLPQYMALRVSPVILRGETVELIYTDPTSGDDAQAIQDLDGNDADTFHTGQSGVPAVVNISDLRPTPTKTEVSTDGRTIKLTFKKDLKHPTYTTTIQGAFTVTVDGTDIGVTGATGGMDAVTLSVSNTIGGGQAVVVSYDLSDAGSEALAYPGGLNVPDFTTGRGGIPAVVNNSELDLSPPALTGAMVTSSGVVIELAFDEDLDLPATIPATLKDAFSVTVDGDTVAISSLAADGSSGLQINLSSRILKDQAVVVSYDQSAAGTNALDDAVGNEVVDFTTGSGGVPAVDNDSTELSDDATLRGLSMSVQNALGNALVGVALSPAFDPGTEMYSVSVAYVKLRVTFMPATNHTDATVAYFDGDDMALADDGAGSSAVDEGHQVNVSPGPNTVKVKVTAPDGTTPKTSTVTVTRSRPTLSAATVPAGGTPVVLQWENDFPSGTGTLSAAAVAAFTVTADGVERQITGIVQEVIDNLLNVTLSTLIYQGQAVVVSYDSTAAGAAALLDTSGREYLSFTTGEDGVPAAANRSTVQAIAPGKPTGLAASASGDTRIDLSWTAPSDGGSAITGYKIEVSTDGSAPWTVLEADTGNTDTRYSHTGLSPGSTRHYRVSAINAGGTSEASSTVSATTTTVDPPTPGSARVNANGNVVIPVFSENLDFQSPVQSDAVVGAFTVTVDDVELEIQSVVVSLPDQLAIELSSKIYQGQTVTISYDQSVAGGDALADADGNKIASFTDFAVTNDSNQVPPTCTLNPGDLWCGTLTVGTGTSGGSTFYGYGVDPGWGSLSPATFTHNGNPILVSALQYDTSSDSELRFGISGALGTGNNFVLHVGSQSFSFAGGSQGYRFPNHGLSWSVGDTVVVRLRDGSTPTEAVVPSLSVWDAAGSDDSDMAFTVTLSDPIAEEVTATWTASIAFGNTALAADLGSPTTGMVTFAPNATTARFVLHLGQIRRPGDRTFRVTLSGVSANAQLVSNWIATGTIIGTPTSCTLNSGDIWCGVVTVGKKAQLNGKILGWGFHQTWHTDGVGALPDRRFVYGGDSYRIDEVTVGAGGGDIPAGFLFFSMNRAFPVADEVRLALYVESIEFKLSEAHGPHNAPTYHWRETGMDWSVASYVTLRLRGDITAAAHTEDSAAPLTAAFEGLPEAHDGETAFTFRIAFSEAVTVTPAAVRTRVLTVTGGAVTGAARVDGEPGVWAITVTPDTREELSIALAPTVACEADGAVCTADGRALSIGAAHLVNGPPDYARESNTEATGTPTISGTPQVGETLTADTSGIADDDGLKNVSFSYQWLADDTAIQGATGSAYTLIEADEGKTVSVRVSFTDDTGNGETLTSTATDAVAGNEEPVAREDVAAWSATMTVEWVYQGYGYYSTDTKKAGSLSPASFEVDGTTYTVKMVETQGWWMYIGLDRELPFDFVLELDGTRFASGDASFRSYSYGNIYRWEGTGLSWRDGDTVEVRLLRAIEDETAVNSAATGAPIISGTVQVGETLTADTSGIEDADGLDNAAVTYQWLADNAAIAGATGSTYTLADDDEGKAIKVHVSFTDDAGNDETLASAATETVSFAVQPQVANSPATGAPTISGTVQVGETLTADTSGIADENGLENLTFTYQWLADDDAIAGATDSTYTLADADEGKAIKVQVSFTDDAGNDETLTSAATDAVAAPEPPASPTGLSATASHDSVVLTWDDPGDDSITGYVILRRNRDIHAEGEFTTLVKDTGAAATTYTDDTVEPDTPYTYRIKAINEHGESERSRWFHIDTPAAPDPADLALAEPPASPTGLAADVSHDSVTLTWDDPGDDSITGYVILRRDSAIHEEGTFETVESDTGSAETTYTDDSAQPERKYVYRIKAINEHGGESERSRWFHIQTQAAP